MSLLEVMHLHVSFPVRAGLFGRTKSFIRAVRGVSLHLNAGETLGIVGESGCGKSTTAKALLRLIEPESGQILLDGTDLRKLAPRELRAFRRHAQMVFQDPYASLDPRFTVAQTLREALQTHAVVPASQCRDRSRELLALVGLNDEHLDRYPHAFSGGQRQRIGIARALATSPKLLVLDEPVSALDVSVQAQVVNLLETIQQRTGVGYLFIAHDMGVVRHVSQRIAVMYLGRVVEEGPAEVVCTQPRHPYTQLLIDSVPALGNGRAVKPPPSGELPSPSKPPSGCAFHPRCPMAQASCRDTTPELAEIASGHRVACPLSV